MRNVIVWSTTIIGCSKNIIAIFNYGFSLCGYVFGNRSAGKTQFFSKNKWETTVKISICGNDYSKTKYAYIYIQQLWTVWPKYLKSMGKISNSVVTDGYYVEFYISR